MFDHDQDEHLSLQSLTRNVAGPSIRALAWTAWLAWRETQLTGFKLRGAHLVNKDLLSCCLGCLVDIRDNDGNDQIDHDQGSKDDQADQEGHGKYEGYGVGGLRVFIEIIELKFTKNHDNDLEEGFARMVELFTLATEADDEEGKAKGDSDDEERSCSLKMRH